MATAAPAAHLAALLAPPSLDQARTSARGHLSSALPSPLTASQLGPTLATLLEQQQARATQLEHDLEASRGTSDALLASARGHLERVKQRTGALKDGHAQVDARLRSARDKLVSGLEARGEGDDGPTLRERLVELSEQRKELEAARTWFGAVAKAEELGCVAVPPATAVVECVLTPSLTPSRSFTVLRSLEAGSLPQAFRAYVGLIEYIKAVYVDSESAKGAQGGAGLVALTSHLVGMANSVWSSLVRVLSRCAHAPSSPSLRSRA